jgi:hypothetical protein
MILNKDVMKHLKLLFCIFLFSTYLGAEEIPEVTTLTLDMPIWAVGFNDAKWLINASKSNTNKIGFFNLSAKKSNMPKEPITQKEDDLGRTSRSLPLYLAERINIETQCAAINYVFVAQGKGPIVSGERWNVESFKKLANDEQLDFIVFGHYEKDYFDLRSSLKLEVWDVKKEIELFSIVEKSLFKEASSVAAKLPSFFQNKIETKNICHYVDSKIYPKPRPDILAPYLDGLGQMLAQTLADNDVISGSSIWGEVQMIEWYRSLRQSMPESDANKLMFTKGIMTSKRYGGVAHKDYSKNFRDFLKSNFNKNDTLSKMSPLFYSEFGFVKDCIAAKNDLSGSSTEYKNWLSKIDCQQIDCQQIDNINKL